jgi:hypothetical protein
MFVDQGWTPFLIGGYMPMNFPLQFKMSFGVFVIRKAGVNEMRGLYPALSMVMWRNSFRIDDYHQDYGHHSRY